MLRTLLVAALAVIPFSANALASDTPELMCTSGFGRDGGMPDGIVVRFAYDTPPTADDIRDNFDSVTGEDLFPGHIVWGLFKKVPHVGNNGSQKQDFLIYFVRQYGDPNCLAFVDMIRQQANVAEAWAHGLPHTMQTNTNLQVRGDPPVE